MVTERGALVDALKGDDGDEDEDEGQEDGEDKDRVEEGPIQESARGNLDLHQIRKPGLTAAIDDAPIALVLVVIGR